jgi:hypothetical protein
MRKLRTKALQCISSGFGHALEVIAKGRQRKRMAGSRQGLMLSRASPKISKVVQEKPCEDFNADFSKTAEQVLGYARTFQDSA